MKQLQKQICISSFNSTGMGIAAQNFISTLCLFSNILCIQEHFLLDSKSKNHSNTDKIRKHFGDKYDMFVIPAFKESSQVCKGRGKGGLATLWNKNLTKYVSQVKCTSFRLQATQFDFPSGSLLILNTYFPCDPRVNLFNEDELLQLLEEMRNIMTTQGCRYNLVLGDLNCHFARNSHFTQIVENFFDDLKFLIFWETTSEDDDHNIEAVDYTYEQVNNGETFTSTIDHFVGNAALFNKVVEAGVIHSGENPSNHSPIFTKIDLGDVDISMEKSEGSRRVNWSKSSSEARNRYKELVTEKLAQIAVPDCVECRDVHCTGHMEDIENYTMDLLQVVEVSGQECLVSTGGGKGRYSHNHNIAGWTQYVKPYSEEGKFWFATWCSAGKPRAGHLHEAMQYSKLQYKYAVRRLKRANNKLKNDKFVQGLLRGGGDIFKEIKKHRGKVNTTSSRIDDHVGSHNIANNFAEIYSKLYNQHQHGTDIIELSQDISKSVGAESVVDADKVTPELVRKALKQMKNGKNDSLLDIQSDCLTSGPDSLTSHLASLFKTFIIHGYVPSFLLTCTLLPLVKDNLADITSSNNYRAIASGSLLLKLLDIIILLLEGDKLGCDKLQFGFQAGTSTSMCSWTATTVIEHYNRYGRSIYACAMDLSKAFDLVEWKSLFLLLMEKKVSPIFLRLLLYVYCNQYCDVKWNSSFSKSF